MTEDELQEVFWKDAGLADQIYALLKRVRDAGKSHAEISIDLNPPERYAYYD